VATNHVGLSIAQIVYSLVEGDQTGTASGFDSLTGAVEIKLIRNAVGHDGDAVSGSTVGRCSLRVSHRDLLVVLCRTDQHTVGTVSGFLGRRLEPRARNKQKGVVYL
jgi:hypothetical protein